jgi:hypothetical protein
LEQWTKPPGMGLPLTSEFLRNLGWSGFKPDRHIRRLFDRWFGQMEPDRVRVQRTERLISEAMKVLVPSHTVCHRPALRTHLRYSLLGVAASPDGISYSSVDNLVWLLGAYVEKKGRETMREYVQFI